MAVGGPRVGLGKAYAQGPGWLQGGVKLGGAHYKNGSAHAATKRTCDPTTDGLGAVPREADESLVLVNNHCNNSEPTSTRISEVVSEVRGQEAGD